MRLDDVTIAKIKFLGQHTLQSQQFMDSFRLDSTPAKRKASALKRRKAKSKRKAKRKSNKRNRR